MVWISIGVIAAAIVVLCVANALSGAGNSANRGLTGCAMPKVSNIAKGAQLKTERSLREEAAEEKK